MSDFLKKFLLEDPRKLGAASDRHVCVGAFGKHPGWDDHIEDLGLETPSLIQAKTLLYVQGIGSQIDSGDWEKLDPGQQVPAFHHLFLWRRASQFLLGRMWASSDGKGRTRYPMIACIHCFGVPLPWALREVLPQLQHIEEQCKATRSAEDIRRLIRDQCTELRRAFSNAPAQAGPAIPEVPAAALAKFIAHPALGPGREGWCRILYQLQSQMSAFAPGRFSLKGDGLNARAQQMRLPTCDYTPAESLLLWSRFFHDQVDPGVPLLITLPLDHSWLDVTLAEPTPHEFFALRASPKKFPLVTEVPYNLDTEFRKRADQYLMNLEVNKPAPPAERKTSTGTTTFLAQPAATKPKWLRWLVGGGGLALLAGAIVAGVLALRNPPAKPGASGPAPGPAAQADSAQAKPSGGVPTDPKAAEQASAAQAKLKAQAEAQAKAQAETLAKAAALARAQEEAKIQAEAEQKKKMEAEQEAKRLAEARRLAEEKAKVEAEAIAKAKAQAEAQAQEKARLAAAQTTPAPAPNTIPKPPAPVAPASSPAPASKQMTNRLGLELVWIPAEYWVGKFEVTQGQYTKVMGSNPSKFTGNDRLPVDSVSWTEAVEFCRKLTDLEKQNGGLPSGAAYTLPTQKQWESFLADATFDQAITSRDQRQNQTGPVGSSAPNQWGLHDLLGNVWEWCLDGPSAADAKRTLLGGAYNTAKVFRYKPFTPTTSQILPPDTKSSDTGFRCVLITQK